MALADADTSSPGTFEVDLDPGRNEFTVEVSVRASDNGVSKRHYTLEITRGDPISTLSSDATLSALGLSEGTLSPTFTAAQTSYFARVPPATARITVTPTANDADAAVAYLDADGAALADADAATAGFQLDLATGAGGTLLRVRVTAANLQERTYEVRVHRNPATRGGECDTVAVGELFCGEMTTAKKPKSSIFYGYGKWGEDTSATEFGSLSPDTFTYRGRTVRVTGIMYNRRDNRLYFNTSIPDNTSPRGGLYGDDDYVLEFVTGSGPHRRVHTEDIESPGMNTRFSFANPPSHLAWSGSETDVVRFKRKEQPAGRRPYVTGPPTVSESLNGNGWKRGQTVEVTLTFDKNVFAISTSNRDPRYVPGGGRPSVDIELGGVPGNTRRAQLWGGSGTKALSFVYQLGPSDGTHHAIRVVADSLRLNGGTIMDISTPNTAASPNANALLGHPGVLVTAPGLPCASYASEIWCATLGVASVTTTSGGVTVDALGFSTGGSGQGSLTNTRVSYGGTAYPIADLVYEGSQLALTFGQDNAATVFNQAGFTLRIGSQAYAFPASTVSANGRTVTWNNAASPGWSAGDEVFVRLTGPSARLIGLDPVLVSNTDREGHGSNASTGRRAQAFTTGSNAGGYTLTSVGIVSIDPEGDSFSASVCETDGSGRPNTTCIPLTAPTDFAAGTVEFTHSSRIPLAASTTYAVVVTVGGNSVRLRVKTDNAEDARSQAGWTIADTGLRELGGSWRSLSGGVSLVIAVRGLVSSGQVEAADPPVVAEVPALAGAGGDGTWSEGEHVDVTVTFSEAVEVDTAGGTPGIGLGLGFTSKRRTASYVSGSGTTALVFRYTLVSGDGAHMAMTVSPDSLALNGGIIRSAATGVDAVLDHNGTAVQGSSARGAGPEASFVDPPESHDGQSGFKLRVRFSGAPSGLSPKTDAASVLEVEGGTVTGAKAETKDADSPWSVTIEPDGNGDVTVRVPVRDCAERGAVCIGGRPLTREAEATVPGPDTLAACQAPALTGGAELVWTGRLGIAQWPGNEFYGFGEGVRGTLDDRAFSIGANDYLVDHVTQRDGSAGPLLFSLESALTAEEKRTLVLHACEDGTALRLADASGPSRYQTYRWNGTGGLDWSGETERTLHLVRDAAAPEFASAAVDGASLLLTFGEALDGGAAPASSAFAVTVGGDARAVDAVEVAGSAVTLTLASAVTAGETVTVAYTAPAGNDPGLQDALGNRVADIAAAGVTNETPAAALPAVSIAAASPTPVTEGTAAAFTLTRTGATDAALTVTVSVDEAGSVLDGAPATEATFAAGSSTATLSAATENDTAYEADGRVTASVVAGNGYTVDGAGASAGVDVLDDDPAPPGEPEAVEVLWSTTMAWKNLGHGWYGGNDTAFDDPDWTEDDTTFRIWLIDYNAPRRELRMAHDGTGGIIADADELSLEIGDYTVEGEAMTAFARARTGTVGGLDPQWTAGDDIDIRLVRRTAETETTVSVPTVSVDDAQVNEASADPLRFTVRLAPAADGAVTVRYATSDVTAHAGADYVGARGVLRFAPGETLKTVEVEVLPDDHNEGSETMTLTLSRPFGAALLDATATGTISNTGPMPAAWLARFGRTVAEQV